MDADFIVIGAGIVGLTAAYQLRSRFPAASILVLEKESEPALHQTARNSGVVHTGVYYKPGSLKAKNCIAGRRELLAYCDAHGIPYQKMHKLIVATAANELPKLAEIYDRGIANGIQDLEIIGPERIRELEPHCNGMRAIYVPHCHILDYRRVALSLASTMEIHYGARVEAIDTAVHTSRRTYRARHIINCAGLYSDRLAGANRIVPFRGEYYELKRPELVNGLIYPVPDPNFPFLGVHVTPRIGGGAEAGPNAVLALGRESYKKTAVSPREAGWIFSHAGFWKMSAKYWKSGVYEMARSFSKRLFLNDLQRLVPEICAEDLEPGGAGIRAQVVTPEGTLLDDFAFERRGHVLHVINAPSPAATASFAIGRTIASFYE